MLPQKVNNLNFFPENIAIIGGGRWARVFADTLVPMIPAGVNLSVHSPGNSSGMELWARDHHFDSKISVSSALPDFLHGDNSAVLIANATADHESAAQWAIKRSHSVLVEKPLCLSIESANALTELAIVNKAYLATAHVLLFDDCVNSFAGILNGQEIISINVLWSDQRTEIRYGEMKKYEAGVPVHADVLPHILSVLSSFLDISLQLVHEINFHRGGAHLGIECTIDNKLCAFNFARNAELRKRIFSVNCIDKTITLDLSNESGVIYVDGVVMPVSASRLGNKPVASMLLAFLRDAATGSRDPRLDNAVGVNAVSMINQIEPHYRYWKIMWLVNNINNNIGITEDLLYLYTELLEFKIPKSKNDLSTEIRFLHKNLSNFLSKMDAIDPNSFFNFIDQIIKKI